jgi:DNA-binding response OmpR family regulator
MIEVKNEMVQLSERCVLNMHRGEAIIDGILIVFSKTETRLLTMLSSELGHPFTHSQLENYIWGIGKIPSKNSLYQCAHRIRLRLEQDAHQPQYLLPIKGFGYMLCAKYSF